jgi:phage FluMu protein gp41
MSEQDSKRWAGLTISGDLVDGVYFAGTRHKRFTLRVPMAGDLVSAQEEHPNAPFQLTTIAVYRRQLLALGDIPVESLTTELLREELTELDLATIADADADLEKKRGPRSAAMPTGDESNTSLSDTATA